MSNITPKLSKRKKKQQEQNAKQEVVNFNLSYVKPLTDTQSTTWESFYSNKHLVLHGVAGTGKSFISLYLSLKELLEDNVYKKIIIVRSAVPARDIGFMPGNEKEKAKIYEDPYKQIFTELFNRGDAYEYFKARNLVQFTTTSFIRGITLNDCIVIVDEMQNMDWGELTTIITRAGENCKMIFCGDFRQSDFRYKERASRDDIIDFMQVLKTLKEFAFIEFQIEDIVRSSLVKAFIIGVTEMGRDL